MKKIIVSTLLLVLFYASTAFSEENECMFITTIKNTNLQQVYDESISEMTDRAFDVHAVSLDKLEFTKCFDTLSANYTAKVTFFLNPIKNDVRVMVTQSDNGMTYGNLLVPSMPFDEPRNIKHLIPVIRVIRNRIDNMVDPLSRTKISVK